MPRSSLVCMLSPVKSAYVLQVVQNTAVLGVTNEGVAPVSFRVCRAIDEASGRDGEAGVPSWLEVYPLDGVLAPLVPPLTLSSSCGCL